MNRLWHTIALLAFAPGCFGADVNVSPIDQLSQASIQSAFQVLRKDYIRKEDLSLDKLNRASLQGLLNRLDFGAELVPEAAPMPSVDKPPPSELLTPAIAYLRPVAATTAEAAHIRDRLEQFDREGAKHLILDLRSPAPTAEFDVAAALLESFAPRGSLLFKLRQFSAGEPELAISTQEPIWTGTVLVLVDYETNNVGETVAAVLRLQHRALLIGGATRGATVRYATLPLDSGWRLRYAHAEMLLADDTSVFRKGIQPDFAVALEAGVKREVFSRSRHGSIKPFIFEQARPRYNEAALVSGKNPELDDYIKRSTGETLSADQPIPRDRVLQRALDLLLSTDHLVKSQLNWKQTEAPIQEEVKAVPVQP